MKRSYAPGARNERIEIIRKIDRFYFEIRCDCGTIKSIHRNSFYVVRSCGCILRDGTLHKHGWSGTTAYQCWNAIKQRCTNPKNPAYKWYGARGISMCQRWFNSVDSFVEDMGEPPKGLSIERIDVNLGYFKENCRWATPKEQARNTRASKRIYHNGKNYTYAEIAELTGLTPGGIAFRVKSGWETERVFGCIPRVEKSKRRHLLIRIITLLSNKKTK